MKVLVVGLGSMGKRRVRNLHALGVAEIAGFDVREDRRSEAALKYGIATFGNIDEALRSGVAAVIVSTPPDLHVPYALKAVENGLHFFTEAGVPDERLPDLIIRARTADVVGMPSCTMRFFAGPRRLKALIEQGVIGTPQAWIYHTGQYLPDWHPWESIQSFYVSNPATGACREIVPFELVWLVDLFGPIDRVTCQKGKLSDLPVAIDDIFQLQLVHTNGVMGQLTVDVLARAPVRDIRVIGSAGIIEWDARPKVVSVFQVSTGQWVEESLAGGTVEAGYVNPEEPYIEEMRQFLRCIDNKVQPRYGYEDDLSVLAVLEAAEASAADRIQHRVPAGRVEAR